MRDGESNPGGTENKDGFCHNLKTSEIGLLKFMKNIRELLKRALTVKYIETEDIKASRRFH